MLRYDVDLLLRVDKLHVFRKSNKLNNFFFKHNTELQMNILS